MLQQQQETKELNRMYLEQKYPYLVNFSFLDLSKQNWKQSTLILLDHLI